MAKSKTVAEARERERERERGRERKRERMERVTPKGIVRGTVNIRDRNA
jgi:hypothetical protein